MGPREPAVGIRVERATIVADGLCGTPALFENHCEIVVGVEVVRIGRKGRVIQRNRLLGSAELVVGVAESREDVRIARA